MNLHSIALDDFVDNVKQTGSLGQHRDSAPFV